VGAVGVEIPAFPLTWHIAYTTACGYRKNLTLFTKRQSTCMHLKNNTFARKQDET